MSSRQRKIGIKQQLREALIQLKGVELYFKEYDLKNHFRAWINAKNRGNELPEKLKLDEGED